MRNTIVHKLAPVWIAGLAALLITGCGSSRPAARPVPGAKLASAVFALSAAQNLTEVREYMDGKFVGLTLIDASRRLDTETGAPPPAIRIGDHLYILLPGGSTGTGASCYVGNMLPWDRLRRFALTAGATVTAVSGHTIDFRTANGRAHGSFEFSAANLIVDEQATVHTPELGRSLKYSWTYSYPATPPAGLVTSPPKNLCSSAIPSS
jgi:hypothetical protein